MPATLRRFTERSNSQHQHIDISLRGDWKSMEELPTAATDIMPGEYVLIVVDSKYRLEGPTPRNSPDRRGSCLNRYL